MFNANAHKSFLSLTHTYNYTSTCTRTQFFLIKTKLFNGNIFNKLLLFLAKFYLRICYLICSRAMNLRIVLGVCRAFMLPHCIYYFRKRSTRSHTVDCVHRTITGWLDFRRRWFLLYEIFNRNIYKKLIRQRLQRKTSGITASIKHIPCI